LPLAVIVGSVEDPVPEALGMRMGSAEMVVAAANAAMAVKVFIMIDSFVIDK